MARLSLVAVLVVCLMGQIDCDSSSRDSDGQNRETNMLKPMLNKLTEIKGILEEIRGLGTIAATRLLSQTQPEETQVAECPICGKYETCNQTTFECELKRCVSPATINMVDTNITATFTEFYGEKYVDGAMLTTNSTKATTTDNYFQINFSDMKIVEVIEIMLGTAYIPNLTGCYFSNGTIETSENCEQFTHTYTDYGIRSDCPGEYIVLLEPVLARCVRVYPAERKEVESFGLEINFSDMKIVEVIEIMLGTAYIPNLTGCYFSNGTIETSENCEQFTHTYTDYGIRSDCPGEYIVLLEPVLARCVRVYPAERKEVESFGLEVRMGGCSAQM